MPQHHPHLPNKVFLLYCRPAYPGARNVPQTVPEVVWWISARRIINLPFSDRTKQTHSDKFLSIAWGKCGRCKVLIPQNALPDDMQSISNRNHSGFRSARPRARHRTSEAAGQKMCGYAEKLQNFSKVPRSEDQFHRGMSKASMKNKCFSGSISSFSIWVLSPWSWRASYTRFKTSTETFIIASNTICIWIDTHHRED